MLDIFTLAFWTDTTRIGTFMFGDAQSNVDYSFLPGVKAQFHSISHHGDEPAKKEQYGKIIDWHMEQLAYFLGRVKSLDEGGKSLLDNSMIMFGGSLKDGNRHTVANLPLILAGRGKGTHPARTASARAGEDAAVQPVRLDAGTHGHSGKAVRRQHGSARRTFLSELPRALEASLIR